jgi:peptidylprolyl isomerase
MNLKHFALIAALVAAFAVAGCGDDNEEPADTNTATEQVTEEAGATEEAGSEDDATEEGKPPKVSGSTSEKPEIATPEGSPPEELVIKDVKKGKGDKAKEGDEVTVHYVGLNWSNGMEFDSSWGRGDPTSFPLEQGSLIDGWVEGIPGMREGGRRLLIIPPDKGYGPAGSPPNIPGNETLVFVVDLEKVK